QQVICVIDLVHDPKHVAYVDLDRARELLVEDPIGTDAVPNAIEGESDQASLGIDRRRTRIAAGDIEISKEIDWKRTESRCAPTTVVLLHDRIVYGLRC